MKEFDINAEWTLESMKKTKEDGKAFESTCFGCSLSKPDVKEFLIAVLNTNFRWSIGTSGVYEKIKVRYCESCADNLISMLEDSENVAQT